MPPSYLHYDATTPEGASARYRWEYEPGAEMFVSLGESGDLIDGEHYRSSTTQVSVRIGQLMRF